MCHKDTKGVRWATLVVCASTVVWGQTAPGAPAPKWRQIGNDAVDISLAALLGPVLYWYIFLRKNTGDPKALAESVVDMFWRANALKQTKSRAK